MAKSKEENARMLDPQRFQVAKKYVSHAWRTDEQQPHECCAVDSSAGSMTGINQYPYGDSGLENAPQLGTNSVFPQQPSGLPQQAVMGTRLNGHGSIRHTNSNSPFSADADLKKAPPGW